MKKIAIATLLAGLGLACGLGQKMAEPTEPEAIAPTHLVKRADSGEAKAEYEVYYHKNGGEWYGDIPTTKVTQGEPWTVTDVVPHWEGHDLLGWNWDDTATTAIYQPGEAVASYDEGKYATLYAIWSVKIITVSYDLNGGTGEIAPTVATYGERFSAITTSIPQKDGCAFIGWYTSKDGGTQVTGDSIFNYTVSETYTLYAHWQGASEIIDDAKEGLEEFLGNWFTADKVAMIMSWITYACTLIVLAVKLRNAIKDKSLTITDVKDAVLQAVDGKVDEAIKEKMGEYLDKAEASQESVKKVLDAFAKILALSQDGSAESRVAILEVLSQLGSVDEKTIKEAKKSVEEDKASKESTKEALEEVASQKDDGTSI